MQRAPYTLAYIADTIGADWKGDADCAVESVASIQTAQQGQLCYVRDKKYEHYIKDTKASVILMKSECADQYSGNVILSEQPELTFARIAALFKTPLECCAEIHSSAVIGEDCQIAKDVSVGAHCVIGDLVEIAEGTIIQPGTIIGNRVKIGVNCVLHARVTLYPDVVLGNKVVLHSGAVIGADGFGLTKDENGAWLNVPQLGSVVLHDNVEVGANTCIDRGAIENTVLERGVRLDNQIQVGHNVRIGEYTAIAACTGIAGSVTIGKHCIIAGAVGIAGHLKITDNVVIMGMSTVMSSITEPGYYASTPVLLQRSSWMKNSVLGRKLPDLFKRVKKLEKQNND
jgi:UDP-3-O-[3-hydroxymyristoyl] glucosamine N-acyltransferase